MGSTAPRSCLGTVPGLALVGLAFVACAPIRDADAGADGSAADTPEVRGSGPVAPGIDVLLTDSLHLVRGRRVGLVTNHTGLATGKSSTGADSTVSTVDVLHARSDLELVALYSPEHGLGGQVNAGERVPTARHEGTGLPIYSLYGATNEPLPEMLEGVDVLLFDIQDIGARYYTYVWTMALSMRAAGAAGIPFVVLDRPDPIGGVLVQGNVLDPAYASFVGLHPVPMRHGMTVGEMARLIRSEFGVQADLHVVPMQGWERSLWYDETDLPWVAPSPNMPTLESAAHYPGTCLFEGTSLSVGRGTERPFQWIGAPWLDGAALAARLERYGLPGVRFEAVSFTPARPGDAKWADTEVHGIRFVMTDRTRYDPVRAAVAALVEARSLAGDRWSWNAAHIDRLAGTDQLRRMIDEGRTLDEITAPWSNQLQAFQAMRARHLIYP